MKTAADKPLGWILLVWMSLQLPAAGFASDANPKATGKAPARVAQPAPAEHGHRRGPPSLILEGAEGAGITLWKPDLETLPVEAPHGRIVFPRTGMDSYHALVAEKDWGNAIEAVIRYEYLRGKPSGRSPRELTAARKTAFEIVPDPLPREHYRYHSGQTWPFLLRYENEPVSGLPLTLETNHGSLLKGISDLDGRVSFRLPDDFPDLKQGVRDKRSAGFRIYAEYERQGVLHTTTLVADYRVGPQHWQSVELGAAVAGLGAFAGLLIGRVRPKKS